MKTVVTLALAFSSLVAFAHQGTPLHLDLELESAEYRTLLAKLPKQKNADDPAIAKALAWGSRLSAWIAAENDRRAPSEQIRLTSAATRRGIPIDKPSIYSEKTIAQDLVKHTTELNADIIAVMNGAAFPAALPLPMDEFIVQARKIDKTYQSAARFKSLINWRFQYAQRKKLDLRSYHFFKSGQWTAQRVGELAQLPAEEQEVVRGHLAGMCVNDGRSSMSTCRARVARLQTPEQLSSFFTSAFQTSAAVWGGFFNIPDYGTRRDVTYTDETAMIVPFNTPSIPKFVPYLKDNVEDEFKFGTWGLKVNYGVFPNGPLLKFEPNVVPHVNGLGGNEIVMDSNQPIEEYESQWTIRHEFGHVIGLPDCYHEFYDEELQAFVNYQLDTTDLMCSRAGNMNERIYQELKRVYFRQ